MNKSEIQKIVVNYIQLINTDDELDDRFFWAWEKIIDLISNEPETAWDIIKKILKYDSSLKVISRLAAGPLEDLLVDHGDKFIDRVEEEAKKNPDFAKLLGGVWQNAMSDEIWERIQKVCDRSWDK